MKYDRAPVVAEAKYESVGEVVGRAVVACAVLMNRATSVALGKDARQAVAVLGELQGLVVAVALRGKTRVAPMRQDAIIARRMRLP